MSRTVEVAAGLVCHRSAARWTGSARMVAHSEVIFPRAPHKAGESLGRSRYPKNQKGGASPFADMATEPHRFSQHSPWRGPNPGGASSQVSIRCKSTPAGQLRPPLTIPPEKSPSHILAPTREYEAL